jgi:hypothetical protein
MAKAVESQIRNFNQTNRREIQLILDDSPSLKSYPLVVLGKAYAPAKTDAALETDLPLTAFPDSCPFAIAQVLDDEFWPEI